MSEQEKKSVGGTGSPVVLVEKSLGSRHKPPFRPVDMQEDAPPSESHHKRSKAPAVPLLTDDLKDNVNLESKDRKESAPAEKYKHNVGKKLSTTKRRGSSPEMIPLAPINVETKKDIITPPQPIPVEVSSVASAEAVETSKKDVEGKKDEDESITEEIAELRTPEVAKITSEWSDDDEEAGGLPRTESRASRVTRAMRTLFCCGVQLETPSERQISPRDYNSGI